MVRRVFGACALISSVLLCASCGPSAEQIRVAIGATQTFESVVQEGLQQTMQAGLPSPTIPPTPSALPPSTPTPTPWGGHTLAAYYGGHTLQECRDVWAFMFGGEGFDNGIGFAGELEESDTARATQATEFIDYLYAYIYRNPESFGYIMKACIDGGWEEWKSIPPPLPFP